VCSCSYYTSPIHPSNSHISYPTHEFMVSSHFLFHKMRICSFTKIQEKTHFIICLVMSSHVMSENPLSSLQGNSQRFSRLFHHHQHAMPKGFQRAQCFQRKKYIKLAISHTSQPSHITLKLFTQPEIKLVLEL